MSKKQKKKLAQDYFTIPEVATILGLSYPKVKRLIDSGDIDHETLLRNDKIVVMKEVLVKYINKTIKVKE